jgi:hypothetical protein
MKQFQADAMRKMGEIPKSDPEYESKKKEIYKSLQEKLKEIQSEYEQSQ